MLLTPLCVFLLASLATSALVVRAIQPPVSITPSRTTSSIPVPTTPVPVVGPFTPPNCAAAPLVGSVVCDESQPLSARVSSFVASLTTAEKLQSLSFTWAAIDRAGLPGYIVVNEGLHGVVFSGAAEGQPCSNGTQFPQTILSSASFDRDLIRRMAAAISTEQRALSNVGYMGLGILSPQINLVRDPRWGRGQETPGEDPYHIGQFGIAFTQGVEQGDDSRYTKVMSVGKHYFGYDLEGWGNSTRFSFNAHISVQDIVETMLPPWQAAIQTGGMSGFMCSYTAINGEPSCAAGGWMNGLARGRWGMPGPVVSDCYAIEMLADPTGHHYVNSSDATMAAALRGGCDISCTDYYEKYGPQALTHGAINATDVDIAFARLIDPLVRLGWFDDPFAQPYKRYNCSHVSSQQHQQLAYDVAAAGVVLLKNADGVLPLSLQAIKTVAVVGPNGDSALSYLGNYAGGPPFIHTLVHGLKQYSALRVINVTTAITGESDDPTVLDAALSAAKAADVTIFVGGLDTYREGEGFDRYNISLPQCQSALHALLEQASARPVISVILSGSSLDLTYQRDSPRTGAIVWGGYSGQDGGSALADLLFGRYSPAGRLPITFYPDAYVSEVAMDDMAMRPHGSSRGRTYKFYTGTPVFPFGFGLSYTTFDYQWSPSITADAILSVLSIREAMQQQTEADTNAEVVSYAVTVTNTGNITSDVSVLGFIRATMVFGPASASSSEFSPPLAQLFDYQRVHSLQPGRSAELLLTLTAGALTQVDVAGHRWLLPASHEVWLGTADRQQAHLTHSFHTVGAHQLVQLNPLAEVQLSQQKQPRTRRVVSDITAE